MIRRKYGAVGVDYRRRVVICVFCGARGVLSRISAFLKERDDYNGVLLLCKLCECGYRGARDFFGDVFGAYSVVKVLFLREIAVHEEFGEADYLCARGRRFFCK